MGWWTLRNVYASSRAEFEAFIAAPSPSCPHDGEPLTSAPGASSRAGVERFCRFDGYAEPRDRVIPVRL
jgi:hypothetical protein